MNKTFACRENLPFVRVSSGIPFMLGFLFSLGFYDDSGVGSKYFPSRVFAVSIRDRPLHKLGLLSVGPRTWIHQAHLIRPDRLYFYPLSAAFFTYGSVKVKWADQWGDDLIFWVMTDQKRGQRVLRQSLTGC